MYSKKKPGKAGEGLKRARRASVSDQRFHWFEPMMMVSHKGSDNHGMAKGIRFQCHTRSNVQAIRA